MLLIYFTIRTKELKNLDYNNFEIRKIAQNNKMPHSKVVITVKWKRNENKPAYQKILNLAYKQKSSLKKLLYNKISHFSKRSSTFIPNKFKMRPITVFVTPAASAWLASLFLTFLNRREAWARTTKTKNK